MPEVTREFEVERPLDDTWRFFTSPPEIAPCVPGCRSYEEIEADVFDAQIDVTVAYTNLSFDTHVELQRQDPPHAVVVEAAAEPTGRIPGSAAVEGTLELREENGHTSGDIDIEFAIRGRLGSLGESAFTHKCAELVDEFLSNVTDELEGGAADG